MELDNLKILMFSYKKISNQEFGNLREQFSEEKELIEHLESNSTLLGIVGIEDRPKDNIKEKIYQFQKFEGIQTIVCTGDSLESAMLQSRRTMHEDFIQNHFRLDTDDLDYRGNESDQFITAQKFTQRVQQFEDEIMLLRQ